MSKIVTDERIAGVVVLPDHILLNLRDGRVVGFPLDWFPRLKSAAPSELRKWEVLGGGFVVRWPLLDEDIEIGGLIAGNPAPAQRAGDFSLSGLRIRRFRELTHMSQAELARLLSVRQATVSDWENEKSVPSPLAASRLQELVRRAELNAQPEVFSAARPSIEFPEVREGDLGRESLARNEIAVTTGFSIESKPTERITLAPLGCYQFGYLEAENYRELYRRNSDGGAFNPPQLFRRAASLCAIT